jgi:Na+-translocating ferredoxin:NAD+ oxidoreductase RNF subunit RnfB
MIIDILIALGAVAAISLVLGILLAVFVKFFGIEDDQRTKDIRACFPGINCGACGFKGCDDYTAALAAGKAKPNLCVPGAETTAAKLAKVLNIEVETPHDVVAFVHCNGVCDAVAKRSHYDGISSCKATAMTYGGPNACRYGCLGCGDCAAVCPANAICITDGIAHVDTSRCLGCGVCEDTCPKGIISMVPQDTKAAVFCSNKDKGADARKACKNACIGCKKCEKTCPSGAITVVNNCAVIDYSKCTGCRECVSACPTGCLKAVFFPDLEEGVL